MKRTTNLKLIEKWIKQRGGVPVVVKGTPNLLRVKFDTMDDSLEKITWAKFFSTYRDKNLAFIYEDDVNSRFCKFINKSKTTK